MSDESLPRGIYRHGRRFRAEKMVRGVLHRRTFETLEEAKGFLAMLEADVRDARAVQAARFAGSATVLGIVNVWWLGPLVDGEHKGGHRLRVSAVTARGYQYYIDAYISRIGEASAQSFARNPGLLKLFYDSLPNRCAWHVHGVLRMAFRDAVTRGLMDLNPCDVVKPAKRTRRRRMIPSRVEVEKLLIAADEQDARWGLFVYLSSTLGTRAGETVALRADDFDEDNAVVRIQRTLTKTSGRPTLKEPKNGEPRDLPIDGAAFWDHVRPFLNDGGFLFRGFYRDAPRTPSNTKPWHPDHAEKRFKNMTRALGMPEYTLHSLRHFVATQLLIEGQPINQVAEFLGHSPSMTLMLYGRHLDAEAMRNVGRAATRIVHPPVPNTTSIQPEVPPSDPISPQRAAVIDQEIADAMILSLAADGPITNARAQALTGMTRRQVSKALARLVGRGLLVRQGTKRGSHYVTETSGT